jgi:hypothetical protein
MTPDEANNHGETRQERRGQKLKKKKERVAKHGKGMAQMYRDAVSKRLKT